MKKSVFVFTGILENVTRAQAEKMVREKGYVVSDTVNARADYLVAGVRPGEKLKRAERIGTAVLNEIDFLVTIQQLPVYSDKPVLLKAKPGILYLIGKIGFEYNDETYKKNEGTTPTKLYRDPNKARAEMLKLEQVAWSIWDHPLTTMCEDLSDAIRKPGDLCYVLALNGVRTSEDEIVNCQYDDDLEHKIYKAISKMSLTDFALFYNSIKIHFYQIHEVEYKE